MNGYLLRLLHRLPSHYLLVQALFTLIIDIRNEVMMKMKSRLLLLKIIINIRIIIIYYFFLYCSTIEVGILSGWLHYYHHYYYYCFIIILFSFKNKIFPNQLRGHSQISTFSQMYKYSFFLLPPPPFWKCTLKMLILQHCSPLLFCVVT